MNTVSLFKSLSEHFTLPPLQVKEGTELNDWSWEGSTLVLSVSIKGKDDEHVYIMKVDIDAFREHCEVTNEIDGSFYEWFEGLSWPDQQVEAETYANKFITEIKADYEAWKNKKAI